MAEITTIRLFKLLITCSIIFSFVGIASAESGTIPINVDNTSLFNGVPSVGSGAWYQNYSRIHFNNTIYNYLGSFKFRPYGATFAHDFETSDCTILTGATSSACVVWYQNGTINYAFGSDMITTGPWINLSLSHDIFKNITYTTTNNYHNWEGLGVPVDKPLCVNINNTVKDQCDPGYYFDVQTGIRATDYWDVSYLPPIFGNLFRVNITKNSYINSSYRIHGLTSDYITEATFNHDIKNFTFTYADGIWLNITLLNGYTADYLVNSTNGTAPATPVGEGGSESGQISYNFTSATAGQSYGFTANISDSNYSALTTYYIYAYDSTNTLITGFPLEFNSQTYSSGKFWTFNKAGGYNATLKYCNLFDLTCSNVLKVLHDMDYASVVIPVPTDNYSVTTDASSYQPGGTIKITVSNPSTGTAWLSAFGVENAPQPNIAWNEIILAGETKTITATIPVNAPKGSYRLNLATTAGLWPIVAQAIFNVTSAPVGTGVLSVIWDETFVPLSTTGTVTTTSNHNASTLTVTSPTGLQNIYVFPADSINYTNINLNEVGIWNARIVDNNNASNNSQANTTVIAGNPSDNETIQNCMSSLNYVCWDKRQYTQGQAFTLTFKLTPQITDVFRPYLEISNPSGNVVFNQSINMTYSQAQNAYIGSLGGNFDPQAPTGVYFARIKIPNLFGDDETRAESATEVIAGATPTTTEGQVSTTTSTNLLNVLGMVAFYGLLIYVGLLYGLIKLMTSRGAQVSGSSLIYLAVIIANLIALIGLFDPFKMYVLVLTWVIAGATFTANRKAVTGGD